MKQLTITQKLQIVHLAKETFLMSRRKIENNKIHMIRNGLCYHLCEAYRVVTMSKYSLPMQTITQVLPEFKDEKPKEITGVSGYWWPIDETEVRVQVLDTIFAKLTKQIATRKLLVSDALITAKEYHVFRGWAMVTGGYWDGFLNAFLMKYLNIKFAKANTEMFKKLLKMRHTEYALQNAKRKLLLMHIGILVYKYKKYTKLMDTIDEQLAELEKQIARAEMLAVYNRNIIKRYHCTS